MGLASLAQLIEIFNADGVRDLRGHVQTIFEKINVIRGVACEANFFLCALLSYCYYYSKILLQLCQLYSTGHFIAEMTLYQMLESGKDT